LVDFKKIFSSVKRKITLVPSFGSFGLAVSEEKIKKISQSETRFACGRHVC
jgi:hypothetical protein